MAKYPALKKALIFLAVLAALFLVYWVFIRAKDKPVAVEKVQPTFLFSAPDTILTMVIGGDPRQGKYVTSNIFKTKFDATGFISVDSTTLKQQNIRDSAYWAEAVDTINGKPTIVWKSVNRDLIQYDFNKSFKWK